MFYGSRGPRGAVPSPSYRKATASYSSARRVSSGIARGVASREIVPPYFGEGAVRPFRKSGNHPIMGRDAVRRGDGGEDSLAQRTRSAGGATTPCQRVAHSHTGNDRQDNGEAELAIQRWASMLRRRNATYLRARGIPPNPS